MPPPKKSDLGGIQDNDFKIATTNIIKELKRIWRNAGIKTQKHKPLDEIMKIIHSMKTEFNK